MFPSDILDNHISSLRINIDSDQRPFASSVADPVESRGASEGHFEGYIAPAAVSKADSGQNAEE